jgi:hypothetical protein
MALGICQLCGRHTELVDSHVWPKFAYKKFVSNLAKGGQFIDLHAGNVTLNAQKQYTRPWFCEPCDRDVLGKNEKYAAEFCERVEKAPTEVRGYDSRLLRFVVSISWRAAKFWHEQLQHAPDDRAKKAYKRWKGYLRGKVRHLGPYTQHLFIIFDPELPLDRGLGGQVFPEDRVVVSQIGPLFMVGLLDRSHLPLAEIEAWSNSTLDEDGGTIKPVSDWRVGSQVTPNFARFLKWHEDMTIHRIQTVVARSKK